MSRVVRVVAGVAGHTGGCARTSDRPAPVHLRTMPTGTSSGTMRTTKSSSTATSPSLQVHPPTAIRRSQPWALAPSRTNSDTYPYPYQIPPRCVPPPPPRRTMSPATPHPEPPASVQTRTTVCPPGWPQRTSPVTRSCTSLVECTPTRISSARPPSMTCCNGVASGGVTIHLQSPVPVAYLDPNPSRCLFG